MRKYTLIVGLPTLFAYLISYFLYDFEFLYFLAFGFIIVGIDLFTMGTFDSIKHSKGSIITSYLLLLASIVMILFGILSFYSSDVGELYQIMISLVVGAPIAFFVYVNFFKNHIAGKLIDNQKNS